MSIKFNQLVHSRPNKFQNYFSMSKWHPPQNRNRENVGTQKRHPKSNSGIWLLTVVWHARSSPITVWHAHTWSLITVHSVTYMTSHHHCLDGVGSIFFRGYRFSCTLSGVHGRRGWSDHSTRYHWLVCVVPNTDQIQFLSGDTLPLHLVDGVVY